MGWCGSPARRTFTPRSPTVRAPQRMSRRPAVMQGCPSSRSPTTTVPLRGSMNIRTGCWLLMGAEFSTNQGHLLGLGMQPRTFPLARDARNALDDVRYLDGVAFVAHPTSPRKDLAWSGWDAEGPWGLEILNLDSLWRQASWPALLGGLLAYPFDPVYAVATVLERTDCRNRALGRAASPPERGRACRRRRARPPLPAGRVSAGLLVVRKSVPCAQDLRRARLLAFGRSRSRYHRRPRRTGPRAAPTWPSRHSRRPGSFSSTPPVATGRGRWETPPAQRLTCSCAPAAVCHGVQGWRCTSTARASRSGEARVEFPARTAGTYRVEVSVAGWNVPWILSNPIYVYGAAEEAVPRPQWLLAGRSPRAGFSAAPWTPSKSNPRLTAESDGATWVDPEVRVPSERDPGGAAARLRFRLAEPGPERPSIWGALVDRTSRDLSGDSGLVFRRQGRRRVSRSGRALGGATRRSRR